MKIHHSSSAISIVEILVAVVLIGLIVVLALPSFREEQEARRTAHAHWHARNLARLAAQVNDTGQPFTHDTVEAFVTDLVTGVTNTNLPGHPVFRVEDLTLEEALDTNVTRFLVVSNDTLLYTGP